ncbi:hypothetical protein [Marinobacterium aestuariivivens]|uniref:Uncharacterized protein n=1 Tax=Marinobacterium aestuariivivens TaxID=1698799 RepID=A0ABW2A5B9_9GAMM
MAMDNNRLLMQLEKLRREINREIINPRVPELALEDLRPMLTMVAEARADYLVELLELAKLADGKAPSPDQIRRLRHCRETFDELVAAANALETVIQRDYLDVRPAG